jgi:hypothetical protein
MKNEGERSVCARFPIGRRVIKLKNKEINSWIRGD